MATMAAVLSAKQELLKEVPRPEAERLCGTIDASILRMLLFLDWCAVSFFA